MFHLFHFRTAVPCIRTKKLFFSIAASYYSSPNPTTRFWISTKPPYPKTQPFSSTSRLNNNMDRNNEGQILKQQLQDTGQQKWGFVIYRCTYGDDESWERFVKIVNERVRTSMDFYGTLELMENLDWRIQDDPAVLDGASKEVVRQTFREWAAAAAAAASADDGQPEEKKSLFVPRFTYCIHVDAESLKSVVEDAPQPPAPDLEPVGYVNLIDADSTIDEGAGDEDGIEDSTQHDDVGWMKVAVDGLAPRTYSLLGESGGWEICYVPPPDIAVP